MERYRSGHNGTVLKTVVPQGTVGSNPTLSARMPSLQEVAAFCELFYVLGASIILDTPLCLLPKVTRFWGTHSKSSILSVGQVLMRLLPKHRLIRLPLHRQMTAWSCSPDGHIHLPWSKSHCDRAIPVSASSVRHWQARVKRNCDKSRDDRI